ncbi:hypothetical protein GCM10010172_07640 [Paractinoplanes ferrugineus]|uniref:Uncharacterized protein n=1 Tax=Paractinoplanes ferrugineus TaxID=113564 RepID=A0A919JBN9_9ACTN|nr:hypothetical protein [Actinoplanes ferrugineus]GIE16867.1 hypothetical protein Afe05nite_87070 [Actinoplanes ferrugineus]
MSDELIACHAALAAFVQGVRTHQDQLTPEQWRAAELMIRTYRGPACVEDKVLHDALVEMVEDVPVLHYSAEELAVAERVLAEYTTKVEERP